MKASELRIGNYIFNRNDQLCKVKELSEDKINAPVIDWPVTGLPHKPIELTEEWLIKFGFQNITLKYYQNTNLKGLYLENIDSYLTFDKSEWRLEQDDDWRDGGNHHDLLKIEYVHQLQNLYFALCGEELELK